MSLRNSGNHNLSILLNTSDIQLNNQIDTTKKYLAEIQQNSFIFPQTNSPYLQDKKLTPWLNKKKYNKNYNISHSLGKPKKNNQTQQSERSQQFLRKIFPNRKITTKQQKDQIRKSEAETKSIEKKYIAEESSFVYIPIKPVKFNNININAGLSQGNSKQVRKKQSPNRKESPRKQNNEKMMKTNININIKQQQKHENSIGKSQPITYATVYDFKTQTGRTAPIGMNMTYRHSWKKSEKNRKQRERVKTEYINNSSTSAQKIIQLNRKISVDNALISNLKNQTNGFEKSLHIKRRMTTKQHFNFPNKSQNNLKKQENQTNWLISREIKNKKFIRSKTINYNILQI